RYVPEKGPETVFDYDGEQERIRKTRGDEEVVYFSGLYERVTEKGQTVHRYYVTNGEQVVAIVNRAAGSEEVRYVHPDNLGSLDVLSDEHGTEAGRRSYDAFGALRNPEWGKPPAAFSEMPRGFTGHELDEEVGLINAKGRLYDPRVGRF